MPGASPSLRGGAEATGGSPHGGQVQGLDQQNRVAPSCLGYLLGMNVSNQLYRDYFINHEIRIPMNHPGFNGK